METDIGHFANKKWERKDRDQTEEAREEVGWSPCAPLLFGTKPTAHADFYSIFLFSVSPPSMKFLYEGPYEAFFFFLSLIFFFWPQCVFVAAHRLLVLVHGQNFLVASGRASVVEHQL